MSPQGPSLLMWLEEEGSGVLRPSKLSHEVWVPESTRILHLPDPPQGCPQSWAQTFPGFWGWLGVGAAPTQKPGGGGDCMKADAQSRVGCLGPGRVGGPAMVGLFALCWGQLCPRVWFVGSVVEEFRRNEVLRWRCLAPQPPQDTLPHLRPQF